VSLGRRIGRLALGTGVFAAALAVTFPTDALVRAVVARATPPGHPALVFARAHLRPGGVRLEDVALRRPDGWAIVTADWVEVRPSWHGLVRDGTGQPWAVRSVACGGQIDATVTRDVVEVGWQGVDLARCAPLAVTGEAIAGIADGRATVRLVAMAPATAEGSLRIQAAAWRVAGRLPGLDTLHADPALLRFALRDGELLLDGIDLYGPDVEATGRGSVRLAGLGNLAHSPVDVALAVVPGRAATPLVRDLLTMLPPADTGAGAYRLALTGTLSEPRLAR